MTQKEALTNLMEGLTHDFRLLLVFNWLEDINWHTEAALLAKTPYRDNEGMEWLEKVRCAFNPAGYSYSYSQEQIAALAPYELADVSEILQGKLICPKGAPHSMINNNTVYQFRRAETWYQPLSYIYGWGIQSSDWTSKGLGAPFVEELLEIIKS